VVAADLKSVVTVQEDSASVVLPDKERTTAPFSADVVLQQQVFFRAQIRD
jgi:hypothetical protein